MTLTQLPGPPPSPSLRSRRHSNSRRTAAHSAARASLMKFSVETCTCTFSPQLRLRGQYIAKNIKFSTYVNLSCKMLVLIVYVRTDGVSPIGQSWATAAAAGGGRCNVCTPECTLRVRVTGMDMHAVLYIQYTVYSTCSMYRVSGNGTARALEVTDTVRCDVIGPGHPSQPRLTVDYLHSGESNACILNILNRTTQAASLHEKRRLGGEHRPTDRLPNLTE